ncbi:probable LRR receptor-like serine/threonine-protein kinase At1g56130 [Malania oleifera]|uniref:probable LRR receptor-like serine/threonine-protein kinase At1g56130 n=1 Tax=Malania oleifera TaxID=397392 RepID=UPI0025ADACCB|nr:probable LRR receptor-like serine/threonine-protein kinase At1g56130 [Malania oleifera]
MNLVLKLHRPSSAAAAAAAAIFCCICFLFSLFPQRSNAQTPTTDPSEARALNSLLQQWDAEAVPLWNISGNPCTGSAVNTSMFEDPSNNPAIVCDCSGATCHITKLRVYALNKRGEIPEVITALTSLTFLKIDQNYFSGPLPAFIANLSALQSLSIAHNVFSGPIPKELGNLKQLTLLLTAHPSRSIMFASLLARSSCLNGLLSRCSFVINSSEPFSYCPSCVCLVRSILGPSKPPNWLAEPMFLNYRLIHAVPYHPTRVCLIHSILDSSEPPNWLAEPLFT